MSSPVFPLVGEDDKIRESHLPARPSGGGMTLAEDPLESGLIVVPAGLTPDPDNSGLYLIGE